MRLIDADEFIANLKDYTDKPMTAGLCATLVELAPTAYDIGKVVKELEEAKHEICLSDDDLEYYQNGIDNAIETVKQGSISDDVCEWHCDEYGRWNTECYELADSDPLEYTYCPYCGKKIKAVD